MLQQQLQTLYIVESTIFIFIYIIPELSFTIFETTFVNSLLHSAQTGTGAYSASNPMGTRGSFPEYKAAGACS
jgi:hypothetical protein